MHTIESIYRDFGQFDKVVTLSFKPDSYSFNEYPDCLTGVFQYEQKERIELERKIKDKSQLSNGYIKFKELLDDVSEEKKSILLKTGINSADIVEIFHFAYKESKNEFKSKETRKIPEPIKIVTDLSNIDYDAILTGFNKRRRADGNKLMPEEQYEDAGIRLRLNDVDIENIKDSSLLDKETGKLNESILYHFLLSKQRNNLLSKEENQKLSELEEKKLTRQLDIIKAELKKSINNLSKLGEYENQLHLLSEHLIGFSPKRYTHGKMPVWIDLERFTHILLRHVSETNIGNSFLDKSKFQYLINDVHELIEIVLQSIDSEIQDHFKKNPEKSFKRHGKMSVYYNGDYYVIDIDCDGRLMTFYKKENK